MTNLKESGQCDDPTARGAEASAGAVGEKSAKRTATTVSELKSMVYQAANVGITKGSVVKLAKKTGNDTAYQVKSISDDNVELVPVTLATRLPAFKVATSDLLDLYKVSSEKIPVPLMGWHDPREIMLWMAKVVEGEVYK